MPLPPAGTEPLIVKAIPEHIGSTYSATILNFLGVPPQGSGENWPFVAGIVPVLFPNKAFSTTDRLVGA